MPAKQSTKQKRSRPKDPITRRVSGTALAKKNDHKYLHTDQRILEAVKMRISGQHYHQIAAHFKVDKALVHRWISNYWKELNSVTKETLEELKAMENARLDLLQEKWEKVALSDDLFFIEETPEGPVFCVHEKKLLLQIKATETLLNISKRRCAINGLDAPKKLEVKEDHNWIGIRELEDKVLEAQVTLKKIAEGKNALKNNESEKQ